MPQKTPPLKRNDEIELTVDAFGSEGQGIGRYDGFAVFVPFALPGETVRVHIIKATASYAIGKLLSISVKSPCRAEPKCSNFGRCGGCTLMHLDYEAQLIFIGTREAFRLQIWMGAFPSDFSRRAVTA